MDLTTSPLVLVINLDRAPQRLARLAARLDALGLPWQRIPAVDGRHLDAAQQRCLDGAAYERLHGMTPLAGELGCYLSHVHAMRRLLASSSAFAVILEDDVQPDAALPEVLRELLQHPRRWDMVKLSAVHSGTPVRVQRLTARHHLCVMLSRCTGSSAYVVNRRAAEAYLANLLPMRLPYDHEFDKGWVYGLKVRMVSPPPCIHDQQVASTLDTLPHAPSRKFRWTRRWPTYRYRLDNECRRLVYGLASLGAEWTERRRDPSAAVAPPVA